MTMVQLSLAIETLNIHWNEHFYASAEECDIE